jgi:hypothetical protein
MADTGAKRREEINTLRWIPIQNIRICAFVKILLPDCKMPVGTCTLKMADTIFVTL